MSIDEANSWLLGSSVPACKFLAIGDTHEGQIMAIEMGVQRDFKTQQPKTWDDGTPMKQMIITLRTHERDAQIENDNGVRKLYVGSKGMRDALAAAVKKAGVDGLALGGQLGIRYVRDGVPANAGINPPKAYSGKYEPPTHDVSGDGYDEPPAEEAGSPSPANDPNLDQYGEEPF